MFHSANNNEINLLLELKFCASILQVIGEYIVKGFRYFRAEKFYVKYCNGKFGFAVKFRDDGKHGI